MAIYTKKGDRGLTSLYGSDSFVKKYDIRVNAYGTVDELNSQLGLVSSFLTSRSKRVKPIIDQIQKDLFEIASEVATDKKQKPAFTLETSRIKFLEKQVDDLEGSLPPLQNFIFPGGSKPGALLHVARTICRRAERELVKLADKEDLNPNIVIYINRLSDTLFMLAREVNRLEKSPEKIWKR